MEFQITSEKHYHETMTIIYDLMNKGETNLTDSEIENLRGLTVATEKFEDEVLGLRPVI
jgi:HTH-type transcriptional regulator/antitoxin HigA